MKINSFYIEDPFILIPDIDFYDTAVLVLSVSGNTKEIVMRAKAYRERNANIVAITNKKDCALLKCADDCFCHDINENRKGYLDLITQIPAMFVIESLVKKTRQIFDLN